MDVFAASKETGTRTEGGRLTATTVTFASCVCLMASDGSNQPCVLVLVNKKKEDTTQVSLVHRHFTSDSPDAFELGKKNGQLRLGVEVVRSLVLHFISKVAVPVKLVGLVCSEAAESGAVFPGEGEAGVWRGR